MHVSITATRREHRCSPVPQHSAVAEEQSPPSRCPPSPGGASPETLHRAQREWPRDLQQVPGITVICALHHPSEGTRCRHRCTVHHGGPATLGTSPSSIRPAVPPGRGDRGQAAAPRSCWWPGCPARGVVRSPTAGEKRRLARWQGRPVCDAQRCRSSPAALSQPREEKPTSRARGEAGDDLLSPALSHRARGSLRIWPWRQRGIRAGKGGVREIVTFRHSRTRWFSGAARLTTRTRRERAGLRDAGLSRVGVWCKEHRRGGGEG